jgi:hypothetical protein
VDLGGGAWRYDYELVNDTLGTPVDEFTIYFDRALFGNLRDLAGPEGWDLLAAQPDPALPDDGFFDGLALGAALAPGATLGTFSVTFDYFGFDAPGSQRFEFIDSATFTVLGGGVTSSRTPSTSVPEPSSFALALPPLAWVLIGAMRRRRRAVSWPSR